jgi:hypothetical protein
VRPGSPFGRAIAEIIDAWAIQSGVNYESTDNRSLQAETATESETTPKWVSFLLAFDVDYRKRRLHFLIEGQNRLYQMLGSQALAGLDAAAVDRLKRKFYDCVEALTRREETTSLNATTRDLVERIFGTAPSPAEMRDTAKYAHGFVTRHKNEIDVVVAQIGRDIDLKASTHDIDVLLAGTDGWPARGLHELLVNYLGFPFWDVLTFPVMPWREAGEFNEIRVDRISAQDATGIERLGGFRLKGAAFNQFAAFLSRAYRENDYLLGRLHAVDRLIDIVYDAAGPDAQSAAGVAALKRQAVLRILAAEERHLPTCATMIAAMRAAIAKA